MVTLVHILRIFLWILKTGSEDVAKYYGNQVLGHIDHYHIDLGNILYEQIHPVYLEKFYKGLI